MANTDRDAVSCETLQRDTTTLAVLAPFGTDAVLSTFPSIPTALDGVRFS